MSLQVYTSRRIRIAIVVIFTGVLFITGFYLVQNASAEPGFSTPTSDPITEIRSSETSTQTVYLPIMSSNYPWISPFGIESLRQLTTGSTILNRTTDLNAGWVRMSTNQHRISWSRLQPNKNGPIDWGQLTAFEDELRNLNSAGITPVVMIFDFPEWAVGVGQPPCAPVQSENFAAFADFLGQLVDHYKTPEFNVHHWELGNEPDVDPDLLTEFNIYGCWGDIDDPYYGGRHYGDMLKTVTPVIKQKDPHAKVWIGGLLLDSPDTNFPFGKPEWFLKGILESGAAPYFDILPYHAYIGYNANFSGDYEKEASQKWKDSGGIIVGKARYLRQLMSQYGVQKPLFVNEMSLFCYEDPDDPPPTPTCMSGLSDEQLGPYYQAQANYLVRSMVRGLSENLMGFIWYTLEGPGWRNGGLLKNDQSPRPVYTAYQELVMQLDRARYIAPVDYGSQVEAYAFRRGSQQVDILWTGTTSSSTEVAVPPGFVEAYTRDGTELLPSKGMLPVGFEPIYIIREP